MSEESVKNDIKISINYMIPGKYTEKEIIEALNNDRLCKTTYER